MERFSPGYIKRGMLLDLKVPQEIDLNYIRWLWSDPLTMKEVGGPIQLSDRESYDWYSEKVFPGSVCDLYFLIFSKNRMPLGEVSIHRFNREEGSAEFNIKIAYKHRGKGFGSEACRLMLEVFFMELNGEVLRDQVAIENAEGIRRLERIGFRFNRKTDSFVELIMTKRRFNLIRMEW